MPVPGMARFACVCLVLAGLATLSGSGCAHGRHELLVINTPIAEAGVVFVADGAGNFQGSSQHLREVIDADHLPLQVIAVPWSHGYGRIIADQIGYAYARSEGCKLAQVVQHFRMEHPGVPVHLAAHSAGVAVVIAALEYLPANTIDRVLLLAPSMSAAYDVRPALRAVRQGMHVFYSRNDVISLGVWTGILGNSDRHWGASSGRIGFQLYPGGPEDACLYSKLYQRAWQPADRDAGNDGRHYGDYQAEFVRLHMLPLLLPSPLVH